MPSKHAFAEGEHSVSRTQSRSARATTENLFATLRGIPWWGVIVAIVGLVVAISVLSNTSYLEAIYFIFDLPWDRQLLSEGPVEGESWRYAPSAKVPLSPDTYRIYAEFSEVRARTRDETALFVEPSMDAAQSAQLGDGETVKYVRWAIVPKQELQMEQRWVYVLTEDGRVGWALDSEFGWERYETVAVSEDYDIRVVEGSEPSEETVVDAPTSGVLDVNTSTPVLEGEVPGGSWVSVYDKYDWAETIARIWQSKGIVMTLKATLLGYGLALLLGLIVGLMLVSRNPFALAVAKLYVEVVRGIPLLVIILYAGFVISPYLRELTNGGVDLRGFPGAVIGLGFGYGAYLAEVFRAGIQSIHRGQTEAARSLGMSYFQAMRYVILPQALRVVLPPLGNDFIAMLKDSSLISVVALPEILQQGRLWVSRTFRAFEGYNTVALFYLVMTLVLSLFVRVVERKTALPGRNEE